ncbi:F-box/LRR-repeat protein 6 [Centroberyx affinis]|uniref:F-box/LRR-repeat protein 6 n=2 Tax=Centroberyx affinis TaxID=166261 RepID=UPI003A5BD454
MDSEAGVQGPSEGSADTTPGTSGASSQGKVGPSTKKAPLKRKSSVSTGAKAKKRKKAKVNRPARLGYTVQEGEDMLLVISNTNQYDNLAWRPKKKGTRKKKLTKGKAKANQTKKKKTVAAKPKVANNPPIKKVADAALHQPERSTDHRWGHSLPEEVLVNIFQMVVFQDGAVPFLCRMARVCQLWNAAASSPGLWRRVSVGFCWIEPGKTQLPKTEMKIKDTVNWLAQNRFSQLRDFSLCHWKKNVDYAVEVVSQSCPHLRSLTLSYCTGVTEKTFQSLGGNSRSLESINVQYSEFQAEGLVAFLESSGSQIRQILFTHGPKNDRLLAAISRGCCPDLELLEINTKLDSGYCQLPICIQGLQSGCPKLKTFRMLNVIPMHKVMRNGPDSTSGFPLLEELCMATTSVSFMTDKDLRDILFGSTKLRVLDLRGCSRITPSGLATLPCVELECLFWGQYFNSKVALSSPKKGLHMLTEKWSGTLQQLDITNHLFTEEDLEIAMSYLAQATNAESLRSLNLSGTKITPPALRLVIGQLTALSYLNLSSCRYLPRGLKRVYRGQEDIRQLLDKLE